MKTAQMNYLLVFFIRESPLVRIVITILYVEGFCFSQIFVTPFFFYIILYHGKWFEPRGINYLFSVLVDRVRVVFSKTLGH